MHVSHSDRPVEFYTLDVVISVGYRVKSQRGVEFRQWVTKILKQFLIEDYAVNEYRISKAPGSLLELFKMQVRLLVLAFGAGGFISGGISVVSFF